MRTRIAVLTLTALSTLAFLSALERTCRAAPGVVNINTATSAELQRLRGVGPARAASILAARGEGYARLGDLTRVRGIGAATVARLRGSLTLSGPTTLAAPRGRFTPRADRWYGCDLSGAGLWVCTIRVEAPFAGAHPTCRCAVRRSTGRVEATCLCRN